MILLPMLESSCKANAIECVLVKGAEACQACQCSF